MSAPKRLNARTFGCSPELIRMHDLEPEDASWVFDPLSAWNTIESKAYAALMHRNIEFDPWHVNGYQLAELLEDTFDSSWRRTPAYEHAIRVNQLEALRERIGQGHWVVLGWSERNLVEWLEDSGLPGGGRWQLRWHWKSVENGGALVSHLNEVARRRWRASARTTPLSGKPFQAQFDAPRPGVLVADNAGSVWPTDELTGESRPSGNWTSQSKTKLIWQSIANGLNAITGSGGMRPPGANPGLVLAGATPRGLAKVVPGYVPNNAIFNSGSDETRYSGSAPPNMTPEGAGRTGAFKEAKRNAGIPVSQQPSDVRPNVDRRGNPQPGYQYDFAVPQPGGGTKTITIRDDAAGHFFGERSAQNRGPHFNDPAGNHYDY